MFEEFDPGYEIEPKVETCHACGSCGGACTVVHAALLAVGTYTFLMW